MNILGVIRLALGVSMTRVSAMVLGAGPLLSCLALMHIALVWPPI